MPSKPYYSSDRTKSNSKFSYNRSITSGNKPIQPSTLHIFKLLTIVKQFIKLANYLSKEFVWEIAVSVFLNGAILRFLELSRSKLVIKLN